MKLMWNGAVAGALAACLLAAGDPQWVRTKSAHFTVYSCAGTGSTQEMAQHFEFVYSFLQQALGELPPGGRPVYLVLFGAEKEYAKHRSNDWSAGAFHEFADRDIIAIGDPHQELATAVHEYFHLWASRQKLGLPLWLNEGLAQLYSTVRPTLGGQVVGDVPPGFASHLSRYGWIPLRTIVSARDYPPSDKDGSVSDFYREAWALTHMLELSADYRAKAGQILPAIQSGQSSEEALSRIYGKTMAEIEVDLRGYLPMIESRSEIYRLKLPKAARVSAFEPAPEDEVRAVLTQLREP